MKYTKRSINRCRFTELFVIGFVEGLLFVGPNKT